MLERETTTGQPSAQEPFRRTSRPVPKVLVLLASHNGERWIEEQIASIIGQRNVAVQLVVRDDASTDRTLSRIAPFLNDDRVRLTCVEKPTGSAAQNYFALIRETPADAFDFVALSDQDDIWYPDKLSTACRRITADNAVGYSSATLATWSNGTCSILKQSKRETSSDHLFGGVGQGCTFVMARSFYHRCRSFLTMNAQLTSPVRYHDWTLYAMARTWKLRWSYDGTPYVAYRQHEMNDTGARNNVAGIRKRLQLIRQGWYADQLKAIASLCAAADPADSMLAAWNSLLASNETWSRRLRIAQFCMRGGRRSITDNIIVMCAAVCGYL